MNLEDLRAAQADERASDSLQPLPPTFYEQAAAYLAERRAAREQLADQLDDPFGSEEIRRLSDEIETAEEVVEAIYERRVGKVVKRASLAAAGMPVDDEGLTDEERALFGDLVDRIEANRETVLEVLDADGDAEPDPPSEAGSPGDATPASADTSGDAPGPVTDEGNDVEAGPTAVGGEPDRPEPDGGATTVASAAADGPAPDDDRFTVRITDDVGEIYGVDDRVYTLAREDVVSLPAPNARPLLDRGAAQRLD